MGDVYAAIDETAGCMVAIKILRADAHPDGFARFQRECRILSRFTDPRIARYLGHGLTEDRLPFLAMEYVEGQPIVDYCDANELGLPARLNLFHQVCLAVAVAHDLQIVHRDLKPSNILVTDRGLPKLLDFGIAKRTDSPTTALTGTGCRLLTPRYASIEQLRGEEATPASDVYSLGVILNEIAKANRHSGFPGFSSKRRLHAIVARATADRPCDRYSSAAQLACDIGSCLRGKPLRLRSPRARLLPIAAIGAIALVSIAGLLYPRVIRAPAAPSASQRDYLVARYLWNKLSGKDLLKAEIWFRKSLERNPGSALAHAGLGDVLYYRGELGYFPPGQAFAQAKTEAERAIQLDAALPAGYVVLASSLLAGELRWRDAERGLKKALELDPGCTRALQGYGCLLMRSGRLKEARQVVERAVSIDPASPILGTLEGRISYYDRDYPRCVRELRAVLDRESAFPLAHYYLGLCYAYLGQTSEAESEMRSAGLSYQELQMHIAWSRRQAGHPELARALLRAWPENKGALFLIIQEGWFDRALNLLASEVERKSPVILSLRADPRFDPLRTSPGFQALLDRIYRDRAH